MAESGKQTKKGNQDKKKDFLLGEEDFFVAFLSKRKRNLDKKLKDISELENRKSESFPGMRTTQ